jgi:hypothetical protein
VQRLLDCLVEEKDESSPMALENKTNAPTP